MRFLALLAAAAATAGVLMTSAPASAIQCPKPTESHPTFVGPVLVTVCVYYLPYCDPGPCTVAPSARP
jgi:hypothetical protein